MVSCFNSAYGGDISMCTLTQGEFKRLWDTPLKAKESEAVIKGRLPLVKDYISGTMVEEGKKTTKSLEF